MALSSGTLRLIGGQGAKLRPAAPDGSGLPQNGYVPSQGQCEDLDRVASGSQA